MNLIEFVRDGFRDPLGYFVLSYLLGAGMCSAWTLATEPLRRMHVHFAANMRLARSTKSAQRPYTAACHGLDST